MRRIGLFCLAWVLLMGSALAADILLGPGDVLRISVYGSADLTLDTRVSEAGKITYPLIGEVQVGQLSVQQT